MKTLELIQIHPLKGSREFKLDDDEIHYVISSPLKNDSLSVVLSVLDAKPIIEGSIMKFVSQINKEPLVELFIDRPDKKTFHQFIEVLKQRITKEDFGRFNIPENGVSVNVTRLDESIDMLKQYVDSTEVESLLAALATLRDKPKELECQRNVAEAFNELGFVQGQILNYAPYLGYLLHGSGEQTNFLG